MASAPCSVDYTTSHTACDSIQTWTHWNKLYISTGSNSTVWTCWVQSDSASTIAMPTVMYNREVRHWSPPEVLHDEAEKKAEAILIASLSPAQRDMYKKSRYFELVTRSGRYRLYRGWAGNIARVDDSGVELDRFCIHSAEMIPEADNLLAQKLMLQFEEDRFLKVANRHPPRTLAA